MKAKGSGNVDLYGTLNRSTRTTSEWNSVKVDRNIYYVNWLQMNAHGRHHACAIKVKQQPTHQSIAPYPLVVKNTTVYI